MSYEAEGTYDVYDERRVKARKIHTCYACGETIPVGHCYMRVFFCFDGIGESIKRCLRCQEIHKHLRELCWDLPGWDQWWPDERLDCGESYRNEWGEDPPEDIQALAFVTPEEMQERMQ